MIRPAHFGYNPETAQNNAFQHKIGDQYQDLQQTVLQEFDELVHVMRSRSIEVDVLMDNPHQERLDAIFPNNWMSTHPNQTLVTYPMFSPIRRLERDPAHTRYIRTNYRVLTHISLKEYEVENLFLEGTGSLIIDHEYGLVYCNRSPRSHEIPFIRFCQLMGYTPVLFDAADKHGTPIYHTNVVMGIGRGYIVINRSAVSPEDWPKLEYYFRQTDKAIIEIDHQQMTSFLGNVAFIHNSDKEPFIVMSDTAYRSMEDTQLKLLSGFGSIIHCDIGTIEKIGGGSVKCMIAENYLERRG